MPHAQHSTECRSSLTIQMQCGGTMYYLFKEFLIYGKKYAKQDYRSLIWFDSFHAHSTKLAQHDIIFLITWYMLLGGPPVLCHFWKIYYIYLRGKSKQCCNMERKWGNAAVWLSFFLKHSNIAPALLVSTWTWSNLLANSFSSSLRTISKKSKCL